jgi:hypothetical protein
MYTMSLYDTPSSLPAELPSTIVNARELMVSRCIRGTYHLSAKRSSVAICQTELLLGTGSSIYSWGRDRSGESRYCEHCGRHPDGIAAILRMLLLRDPSQRLAA